MAELQQFSLTFGLRYGDEEHPTFAKANPRGWVTVLAPGYEAARTLVHEKIGNNWAFLYPVGEFRPTRYPAGEIARWSTDEPEGVTPDLIDPVVDLPRAYVQLSERIQAVFAIHKPFHGVHGVHGVYCAHCPEGDDDLLPWPCPTAQALGVTA